MALRPNGTVVVWGDNTYGQTNVPAGLSNVVAISAGGAHCLALKGDGTAVSWGAYKTVPAGLSNVVAVAGGDSGSLFLRADGTVAATGTAVPANVTNIIAIAAGGAHYLALKADGTVTGWGDNSYSQISIPAGLNSVVAIAAGDYHSTSLRSDGTVVAWGKYNIGSGYVVPVVPGGLTNVDAIAAGSDHDLALLGNTAPATKLDIVKHQLDGKIQLQFSGTTGQLYIVEASTNFMSWATIGVADELSGGAFEFQDANSANFPNRFYRVWTP
jgi:hypothetical protein